LKVCII